VPPWGPSCTWCAPASRRRCGRAGRCLRGCRRARNCMPALQILWTSCCRWRPAPQVLWALWAQRPCRCR